MPKPSRKRQRLAHEQLVDEDEKDDEEKRLESLLFGTKFAPSLHQDSDLEDGLGGGKEMENLLDSDLFFVDDGPEASESLPAPQIKSSKKPAAWSDPSDPPSVSLASDRRKRKLRDAPSEDSLTGREYESRLRRQFERINPEPQWAKKARKRRDGDDVDASDDDELHGMLSSTAGILSKSERSSVLPSGTLSIERLRDVNANQGTSSGEVKCMAFHPSPKVPVLCVGTGDRRIRLYNVDGHTSPLLQTLHTPALPFTSCQFHPTGSHLLLTGPRPFYYIHDLQSGNMHQSKIWGPGHGDEYSSSSTTDVSSFSPTGDVLAVAGRNGSIQLLDFKNSGQVLSSLKCSSGGGIKSMRFVGDGSRDYLTVLTNEAEVYLWDIGEKKCVNRWKDFGGFRGGATALAGTNSWLTVGSNTGLVNVYGADSLKPSNDSSFSTNPDPVKTLSQLTTSISSLCFNHNSQMLAVASKEKKDSLRLIHFPSLTAFSNWPTSSTPLGHVSAVDFSAQSEYLAVGNTRGRVLLYWLRDFAAR